ncbi:hypothetical protein [Herbaspirillum rubrisubalbicans]|uniref:hypothetical protein n=2 Tax=Herbaspirillum rubrisubalbicans TaxID=80842 RepID=UPI001ED9BF4D|nr:hypothetical protein [Herbaspirillum rubrisubalbicans]
MTNQDVLEFVLLEDCVVDVEDGATRIAEDVFNTLFSQATDKYIRAAEMLSIHAASFQGPLEIDRMFSPDGIAFIVLPAASLYCAVTPFLRSNRSGVRNVAQRDSFSLGSRSTSTDSSRLWHGLEQTSFKPIKRFLEPVRPYVKHRQGTKTPQMWEAGNRTVMRCIILVKRIPVKSLPTLAFLVLQRDKLQDK